MVLAAHWLPAGSDLEGIFNGDRTAAAAELARRYFTSHGPAGERDLAWWSEFVAGWNGRDLEAQDVASQIVVHAPREPVRKLLEIVEPCLCVRELRTRVVAIAALHHQRGPVLAKARSQPARCHNTHGRC